MFVEIIVRQLLERTTTNKITISNLMYHMGLFLDPFKEKKRIVKREMKEIKQDKEKKMMDLDSII